MKVSSLIAVFLISLLPTAVSASVDISIGGNLWYSWWEPAWSDAKIHSFDYMGPSTIFNILDEKNFQTASNFLYGPSLSIRFLSRWTLSSVFMCGTFLFKNEGYTSSISYPILNASSNYVEHRRDIFKWDLDSTLSYSIVSFFKVFLGLKGQGYTYDEVLINYQIPPGRYEFESGVYNLGPGLGVGFTVPLAQGLFLLSNISGLALWGTEKTDLTFYYPTYSFLKKRKYFSYGGSASVGLAYYIDKIGTTLSMGGRYQILRYRQNISNEISYPAYFQYINGRFDHFFGVTFSMTYTFSIGKRKEQT